MNRINHLWSRIGRAALAMAAACLLCVAGFSLDKKEYRVAIVMDTQYSKFMEVQDGLKVTLDRQLAAAGSSAKYTSFDTKLDPTQAASVLQSVRDGGFDLIFTVNRPNAFADTNITLKLTDPAYRFVSLNPIPVQSRVAKTWDRPGGNVTCVGVFLQFDSILKVAKILRPQLKEVASFSWDAMKDLNAFLEQEIRAACQRQGLKLIEFKLNASMEDEFAWTARMDQEHPDIAVMSGISAWVHKDGSPSNTLAEGEKFVTKNIRHILLLGYDEAVLKSVMPVGTCVIWYDLGAQLADKGFMVLSGAKPGDLAWEYPRKYNLMFNTALAKLIGLTIPNDLLSAAYRIYTDLEGHYVGQKN